MTSLQGYIRTDYEELVELFGKPECPGDKVICEWDLSQVIGEPCYIYCYKEYRIPKGMYDWHIGGHDKLAVAEVYNIFDKCGGHYEEPIRGKYLYPKA